jgi:hypothetical protein
MRMKNWRVTIVLAILAIALALLLAQRVRADDAPPPNAAASDVTPGQGTQVQMVAEQVVLEVRLASVPRRRWDPELVTTTVAFVTADFVMRNLGSAVETLDVRFPMGWPSPVGGPPAEFGAIIQDVKTYVDGAEIPWKQVDFDGQPWAVRSVRFAPGQDVRLTVQYRAEPIDWGAFVDFYYILETGAGWRGPIGQGDIIFRFPYPVDPDMRTSDEPAAEAYYPSKTPPFVVEGNQLRWHFENLEPKSEDNVRLSMLKPERWQAILAARRQTQSNPNDPTAHLVLAQAYYMAVPIQRGYWPERSTLANRFGPLAEAEFKRAIQLAPKNIPARLAFANFLAAHSPEVLSEPYRSQMCEQIQSVLALDPNNQDAQQLAIERGVMGDPACFPEPTAVPFASRPVTGSVVLQGGACCVGGAAGSPVSIRAAFTATSPLAKVTEMRTATRYGGGCLKEGEMASIPWEPFAASKRFTVTAAINWIGFYASVQYRDAQGNLSPVVCDDVSVEGMPPRTPYAVVPQPTRSPASTALPQLTTPLAPTATPKSLPAPGVCGSGAIVLLIAGLVLCTRLIFVHV